MNGPSIWQATRDEWNAWAVVVDDDRRTRPATVQELLNRSVVVEELTESTVLFHVGKVDWHWGDYPGSPIATGTPQERLRALPPSVRARVMRETVMRKNGDGGLETIEVRAIHVAPADVMDEPPHAPVIWSGERA